MTDPVTHSVFGEIAALLVLAAGAGFVGLLLRQPLIVSFVAVGLLAGPAGLDIVRSKDPVDLFSELGIALLLFLVGIKLDVSLIRSLGAVALTTGLGQVAFTSVLGFLICLALGLDATTSLYVAVALTFSSTIIIVKLLSDKREIESLHGQVALGFLIVQDLVVVVAMLTLSAFGVGSSEGRGLEVAIAGIAMLGFVVFFVRYLAEPLTERLAPTPELLICVAIAQAAAFAAFGEIVGFGKELGGLLAGVSLASTRYRDAIAARLAPLRDFLLLFFFVGLGTRLDLAALGSELGAAIVLSLFVLIGNPLIVLAIMGAMGYRKRTAFLAGLTVAQISEFSLVFIAMGVSLGHVGNEALGLVTLVGLVTIAASTYMITYSHHLFAWIEPWLGGLERRGTPREPQEDEVAAGARFDGVVFGLGRFGSAMIARLHRRGMRVLGVDFNPAAVRRWRQLGVAAEYGDAADPEFVSSLPLRQMRWVVSTIPAHYTGVVQEDSQRALLHALRDAGFEGRIAMTSHRADHASLAGVDLLLNPFEDAADRAVELIVSGERPERPPAEAAGDQVEVG